MGTIRTYQVAGIYEIRNKENNKVYIGSAVCLTTRRASHFCELRKNGHKNTYLQRSFNKYGEDNFVFSVLEIVKYKKDLIQREQVWMDKTKCCEREVGYNLRREAGSSLGSTRSKKQREAMSIIKSRGPYTFISPGGFAVTRGNFSIFAKEFNMHKSSFRLLHLGKCKQQKGWTLPKEIDT